MPFEWDTTGRRYGYNEFKNYRQNSAERSQYLIGSFDNGTLKHQINVDLREIKHIEEANNGPTRASEYYRRKLACYLWELNQRTPNPEARPMEYPYKEILPGEPDFLTPMPELIEQIKAENPNWEPSKHQLEVAAKELVLRQRSNQPPRYV